jgi:S1-C subfamily serine protease
MRLNRPWYIRVVLPILAMANAPACFGQADLEVVKKGTSAVASVRVDSAAGVNYYSAFCVDISGLYVTSAAVVSAALDEGAIQLVLSPGEKDQESIAARILRCNEALGLAVLVIKPDRQLVALELGRDEGLRDTLPVAVFGFTRSREELRTPGDAQPHAVATTTARITSLKKLKDQLAAIQIDGQLDSGYTGGPVLDPAGKVIGVVQGGVIRAQINFAIPVGRLSEYLASPLVLFNPPAVDLAKPSAAVDWTVKVTPAAGGIKLSPELSVAVSLPGAQGDRRRVSASSVGAGLYTARVVPLAGAADRLLTLAISTTNGSLLGVAADLPLRIGGKATALGDLQSIRMGRPPRATLRDGTSLRGEILGLGRVELLTEAGLIEIDLRRVSVINVMKTVEFTRDGSLRVAIEVWKGKTVLCTETRRVDLRRAGGPDVVRDVAGLEDRRIPSRPRTADAMIGDAGAEISGTLRVLAGLGAARSIHPPSVAIPEAVLAPGMARERSAEPRPSSTSLENLAQTTRVVMLPGKINEITPAGAGRYLLLTMRDAHSLAIFDVNAADVVKTISLPAEKVLVAGGGEKFIMVFSDRSVIERWDLATLEREDSRPVPIRPKIWIIGMGSDSSGPILAGLSIDMTGLPMDFRSRWCFIDPVSLKVLKVREVDNSPLGDQDRLSPGGGVLSLANQSHQDDTLRTSIRASDDGSLFLIGDRYWGRNGKLLYLSRGSVKTRNYGDRTPFLLAPDGHRFYLTRPQQLRSAVTDLAGDSRSEISFIKSNDLLFLPSSASEYFVGIGKLVHRVAPTQVPQDQPPLTLTLYASGSLTPLVNIEGLPEMHTLNPIEGGWQERKPAFEYRFRWVPSAELLITVPITDDRLVLRRIRLSNALASSGPEPLHVTSDRSLLVTAGKKLSHRIEVKSAKGGVKLTLTRGPEGLTVTPDGLVEWNVPDRGEDFEETVVFTIEDKSEHPLFHKLTVRVSRP